MSKNRKKRKKKNTNFDKQIVVNELVALTHSYSLKKMLQAFNIIKNRTPKAIKTFDSFDEYFDSIKNDFFINNFLYDLDMELDNNEIDTFENVVKRAEVAQWVYTQFSNEKELNLGNFRNYEAESLWDIGKTAAIQKRFKISMITV